MEILDLLGNNFHLVVALGVLAACLIIYQIIKKNKKGDIGEPKKESEEVEEETEDDDEEEGYTDKEVIDIIQGMTEKQLLRYLAFNKYLEDNEMYGTDTSFENLIKLSKEEKI